MTATVNTVRTSPAATASRVARALAGVLGFGMPVPGYITIKPDSTAIAAVRLQLSDLPDVRAWADRFGAEARESPADDGRTWAEAEFTYYGVWFKAYAIYDGCAG